LQVTKVLRYKDYATIIRNIFLRICILIKGKEFTFFIQLRQYSSAMSTTTESAIHIYTIGLDRQTFQGFMIEDGDMITVFQFENLKI